ncbi:MAG: hypothetical protein ACI4IX_06360 [Acutalibacteraceae bacterium]
MDKEKNTYLYSAAENKEIKRIREKYETPEKKDSKMEQLRKLDASVHNAAVASSLAVGIIGALILGFGMSCALVWSDKMFVAGIIFGIIGIIIAAFAYPVYKAVTEKKRKEVAPLILELTDELLK